MLLLTVCGKKINPFKNKILNTNFLVVECAYYKNIAMRKLLSCKLTKNVLFLWSIATHKIYMIKFEHMLVVFVLLSTETHQNWILKLYCIVVIKKKLTKDLCNAEKKSKIFWYSSNSSQSIRACEYNFTNILTKNASLLPSFLLIQHWGFKCIQCLWR